jgi:UDP-glucose 4-epimerase
MRIIILGAGYLGYNLYGLLKDHFDIEVWGIDSPYVPMIDRFRLVNAFDPEAMAKQDMRGAVIIDAIGLVANTATSEDEDKALDRFAKLYQTLITSVKQGGAALFVCFSSGGTIYGNTLRPISEKDPVAPMSLYAKSKEICEQLIRACGMDYLILRLSNPYGGFQTAEKKQGVIPILIRRALKNEPFEMWVDDSNVRDYFYITDLAAFIKGLLEQGVRNETVNVGSGQGTSLREIIAMVEESTGKTVRIEQKTSDVPVVQSIVLDITKLKQLTGLSPEVTLKEGIALETARIWREL